MWNQEYPPKKYEKEYWLTLAETAYAWLNLPTWTDGEMSPFGTLSTHFKTAFTNISQSMAIYDFWDSVNSTYNGDCAVVLDELGRRYRDHLIACYRHDDPTEKIDAVTKALAMLANALNTSYVRYQPVLNAFKAQETTLLAQISTSSSGHSRFNDTPQDGGLYDDDTHTTNVTESSATSTTDGATPADRLDEIRKKWRSIRKEWTDSLGALLLEEENL